MAGFCIFFTFWGRANWMREAPRRVLSPSRALRLSLLVDSPYLLAPFWNISTSIVIVTSLPTTSPPLSMVAFHFTP